MSYPRSPGRRVNMDGSVSTCSNWEEDRSPISDHTRSLRSRGSSAGTSSTALSSLDSTMHLPLHENSGRTQSRRSLSNSNRRSTSSRRYLNDEAASVDADFITICRQSPRERFRRKKSISDFSQRDSQRDLLQSHASLDLDDLVSPSRSQSNRDTPSSARIRDDLSRSIHSNARTPSKSSRKGDSKLSTSLHISTRTPSLSTRRKRVPSQTTHTPPGSAPYTKKQSIDILLSKPCDMLDTNHYLDDVTVSVASSWKSCMKKPQSEARNNHSNKQKIERGHKPSPSSVSSIDDFLAALQDSMIASETLVDLNVTPSASNRNTGDLESSSLTKLDDLVPPVFQVEQEYVSGIAVIEKKKRRARRKETPSRRIRKDKSKEDNHDSSHQEKGLRTPSSSTSRRKLRDALVASLSPKKQLKKRLSKGGMSSSSIENMTNERSQPGPPVSSPVTPSRRWRSAGNWNRKGSPSSRPRNTLEQSPDTATAASFPRWKILNDRKNRILPRSNCTPEALPCKPAHDTGDEKPRFRDSPPNITPRLQKKHNRISMIGKVVEDFLLLDTDDAHPKSAPSTPRGILKKTTLESSHRTNSYDPASAFYNQRKL